MPVRFRYESFGGIIASTRPAFLAHISKTMCRLIGQRDPKRWTKESDHLSAPTEVHFSLTSRCTANCLHCYTDSRAPGKGAPDLDLAEVKKHIDHLARIKVFSVALGGGESLLREDLLEITRYAREKGIVPNLTVNPVEVTAENVHQLKYCNQVNISLDSLRDDYPLRPGSKSAASDALTLLHGAGLKTGFNTVLTKANYSELPSIFAFAAEHGVKEIECLRLKPGGRGQNVYYDFKLTAEQHRTLYPDLLELARKHRVAAKLDCSFMPMVLFHQRGQRAEKRLGIYGCEAGNVVLGVDHSGQVSPCSFAPPIKRDMLDFAEFWDEDETLNAYRTWPQHTRDEDCKACDHLSVCKGGCHPIASFEKGDFLAGDPDCPFKERNGR